MHEIEGRSERGECGGEGREGEGEGVERRSNKGWKERVREAGKG